MDISMSMRSVRLRRWMSGASFAVAFLSLAACQTLPAEEAVAFRKLATANRDAFVGLTQTEADAVSATALTWLSDNEGRLTLSNCTAAATRPCELSYVRDGTTVPLSVAAPNSRALIGAIARYGEQMAELAEATDLKDAKAKAEAAGGSVKALVALVLPGAALAGPLIDATVFAANHDLEEQRRQAMLINARAADRAIATASTSLGAIATPLRDNIRIASEARVRTLSLRVTATQEEERTIDAALADLVGKTDPASVASRREHQSDRAAIRAERMAAVAGLQQAARDLNAANGLAVDYSALARAHAELIRKLENPDRSLEQTMTDLNTFLTILDAADQAID